MRAVAPQPATPERVVQDDLRRIANKSGWRHEGPVRQRRGGAADDRMPVRRRPLDVGVAMQCDLHTGIVRGGSLVVVVTQKMKGQGQTDR